MKKSFGGYAGYFINLFCPALLFGAITGVLTAVAVTLYKLCAGAVIAASESVYTLMRARLFLLPAALVVLFLLALLFARIYRRHPNFKGGGIPTSIGILRGIIRFHWLRNLVSVFLMSIVSFFIGVPLGNEGPSVQMGTAIGKGSVSCIAKKHSAWARYAMTGGACAGFSAATGAPISGIMFAVEEAHQRISPTIILSALVSVVFARLTTELISPLLGVSESLFPSFSLPQLMARDLWIPLFIGAAVGFFAVLFLKYYRVIRNFFRDRLSKVPDWGKIFLVFAVTLFLGLVSYSFLSTGHDLMLSLFETRPAPWILLGLLAVRATVTLSANTVGITGGIFLPILSLGALLSAAAAGICIDFLGVDETYYILILVLGITACVSGMMKMPLTAIFFAVEALSCADNILPVMIVAALSYAITEIFEAKSINDSVLDSRIKENAGKPSKVIDTFLTVEEGAFAVGKQIRDILWPYNLFVLSVKRKAASDAVVDEHGGKAIRAGDVLHVRYSTYDEAETKKELIAIVGDGTFDESETNVI